MSPLTVIKFPHPALRAPAKPVAGANEALCTLAAGMIAAMYSAGGVGLAAPQINRAVRLIVAADGENAPLVIFNPTIVAAGEKFEEREEGCLSIPGISAVIRRPATVSVEGIDMENKKIRVDADGLLATCLQHEIDHLNGVLFIDYLSPLKRNRLLAKYRKISGESGD